MRAWFNVVLAVALGTAVAFLLLPLLAIFLRTSPGGLISAMRSDVFLDALIVSFKTSLIAHVFILVVGTPVGYLLATRGFFGRRLVIALIELPLVLPPAVAGVGLLAAFGRFGLLGETFDVLGWSISLTQGAVVLAVLFVASPFYLRQAVASFEAVDRDLLEASATLGATPWRTFHRVALPLASGGLAAGSGLAWARGLGEFGATIMFAGSLQGVTQTLPLAIYAQLGREIDVALAIGALLVLVSAAVLVAIKVLMGWKRSQSTSPLRFGSFA